MQDKIEQAVDEFLNSEHSVDDHVAIWELLADEVQNGDQDIAIEQARRVTNLTKALAQGNHCPALSAVFSLVCVFHPVLKERGMIPDTHLTYL